MGRVGRKGGMGRGRTSVEALTDVQGPAVCGEVQTSVSPFGGRPGPACQEARTSVPSNVILSSAKDLAG